MSFSLKRKKGDICPICEQRLLNGNFWVRYHIRYGLHPIVILACRYCNYVEWALRNSKNDRIKCATPSRVHRIIVFQRKFGITV